MRPAGDRIVVGTYPRAFVLGLVTLAGTASAQDEAKPPATYPDLPSEIPAKFEPTNDGFDHVRRDVMIPMRDGVKLHTVILVPKGAKGAPILLTRTPYDADKLTSHAESAHLGPVLNGYDNAMDVIVEGGYIRVVQDVRGKHGSEGDYVVNRPLARAAEPDARRSRDRHVRHHRLAGEERPREQRQGRHPRDLVRRLPAADGARRSAPGAQGVGADEPDGRRLDRRRLVPLRRLPPDQRDLDLQPGRDAQVGGEVVDEPPRRVRHVHAGGLGRRAGSPPRASISSGFWRKLTEHPAYDAFWRDQAVDKLLAERPLKVPVMLVHSLWDQEDIYGAPAVYKAIEPKDTDNDKVFLVIGPWHHGQMIGDGSSLGAREVRQRHRAATSARRSSRPFLDQYLKDGAPKADIAPVTAFETGTNAWRRLLRLAAEGRRAARRCEPTPLYLRAGLKLSFDGAERRRGGVRGVRLRPGQAGPLPRAPDPADGLRARATPGRNGSSTTSARPPGARTSWRSSPTC